MFVDGSCVWIADVAFSVANHFHMEQPKLDSNYAPSRLSSTIDMLLCLKDTTSLAMDGSADLREAVVDIENVEVSSLHA